jgi:hypothetical protein
VISLLLFFHLAKQSVSRKAVPIAQGLFATSLPLIYYSSEAKQYSSDVAITLLLSSAAIYYASARLTFWRVALFGVLGAAAVWFSHPAAFVLAGIGLSLVLFCPAEERSMRLGRLSIVFLLWGVSLGACYLLFLRRLSADQFLLNYWSFSFPPSHLFSVAAVEWFTAMFFGIFQNPVGLDLSGIAALAFLIGCVAMLSGKRQVVFILISPLLFTLLAAAFHKYPFSGRLLLFAVPALLLVVAEGAEHVWRKTKSDAPIIGACLIGLLFFYPLLFSSYHLFKPVHRTEIKPVLNFIVAHAHQGDVLYLQSDAIPAFRYYLPRFHFSNVLVTEGSHAENLEDTWAVHEKDLDELRGRKRVWILFSHLEDDAQISEGKLFLYFLDKRGTKLDGFQSVGAATYLYDLDRPSLAAN